MEAILLVLLVAAAASVCPAMMWWQRRRGRDPACQVPMRKVTSDDEADLDELRRRHEALTARIAELEDRSDKEERPGTPVAR